MQHGHMNVKNSYLVQRQYDKSIKIQIVHLFYITLSPKCFDWDGDIIRETKYKGIYIYIYIYIYKLYNHIGESCTDVSLHMRYSVMKYSFSSIISDLDTCVL